MRAPGWVVIACASAAFAQLASAEPKRVDSKAFADKLEWFQDAQGGTYAVEHDTDKRVYYGTGKQLYEQVVESAGANGDAWSVDVWAPRVPEMRPGSVERAQDGTYRRFCDTKDDAGLVPVTGEKAKKLAASVQLMTPANERVAVLLARDDFGVYYYVDKIRGGQSYRVFVGKKGAMKQEPLADVAIDEAGSVFSTKSGDLRLVTSDKDAIKWVRGDKATQLHALDVYVSSPLIWKQLGIYGFLGNLCENA